jgi:hypothetical protein
MSLSAPGRSPNLAGRRLTPSNPRPIFVLMAIDALITRPTDAAFRSERSAGAVAKAAKLVKAKALPGPALLLRG